MNDVFFSVEHCCLWPNEAGDGPAPALDFIAPLKRRRLSATTRLALYALNAQAAAFPGETLPLVHVTRFGEYERASEILGQLGAGQPASPAAFAMSVHNTPAAIHSILAAETGEAASDFATTLSGARASLESGLVEAVGLLAAGHARISLIFTDSPLPAIYPGAFDHVDRPRQLGLVIGRGAGWRLSSLPSNAVEPLRFSDYGGFFAGRRRELSHADGRLRWTWTRMM